MTDHRHNPKVVQDSGGRYYASCNCGWNSGPNRYLLKWQAEDQVSVHLANVNRALASLRRREPSLREERDHAAAMLADPNTSAADRQIWQILYDGAAHRLNADAEPQDGLW